MRQIVTGVTLFVVFALTGCDVGLWEHEVRITLPDLPGPWAEAWRSAGYVLTVQTASGVVDKRTLAADTRETLIRLPKESPVALLAHPVWDSGPDLADGEGMAPAGAVWPERGSPSSLDLTYRHGAAASVVARLLAMGVDLREYNVTRFIYEIDERLGDDPWSMDMELVIEKIKTRSMRASYLRPRETVEATLAVPAGTWLPWSPFAPMLDGTWPPLPHGVSRFYGTAGGRIVATVEENDEMWYVLTR